MSAQPRSASASDGALLRALVLPAYLPTLLWAMALGALAPMVALSARGLGASVEVAALVVGLGLVVELLLAVPVGKVVDRVGERRTMLGAAALLVIACVVGWRASALWELVLAVVLQAPCVVAFIVARMGYIADSVPVALRGRALSLLGGVARVGVLIGPFMAAPVIAARGPQAGYLVGAVAAALGLGVIALTVHDPPQHAAEVVSPRVGVREVIRTHRRVLLTVGVGVLIIGLARSSFAVVTPLWADHIGVTAAQTAVLFGIIAGVEVLFVYPAGSISDRWGRVASAVPTAVLIGAGLLLMPLTDRLATLMAVGVLIGIGNGLGSGIVMTLGVDAAPTEGRAAFLSLWRTFSLVGHNGAAVLVAAVTAIASLAASAVTVGVIALAGALWLGRWLPEYDPRKEHTA